MSSLMHGNLMDDQSVTVSVTNISGFGSLVDVTSQDKIKTKQLKDAYVFNTSGGANLIKVLIENIPNQSVTERIAFVAVMNINNPPSIINSVKLYNGATLHTTTNVLHEIGNNSGTTQDSIRNDVWERDGSSTQSIDKIEIEMSILNTGVNHTIGNIYIGQAINLKIKPSVTKSGVSKVSPDVSKGGQYYYVDPVLLKKIDIDITTIDSLEYDAFDLIVESHGTSKPLFLFNDKIKKQSMYCTFDKIPVLKTIPVLDESGGWNHSGKISLIENK